MKQTSIYALHDPRNWAIRYVGKANDPERRMRSHMRRSKYVAMRQFVSELRELGLELKLSILCKCSQDDWEKWERFWIATVRASGAKLFNIAAGGNAPVATAESCRQARIGKKDSTETRRNKSLAAPRKHSPEHNIAVGLAQRGRKFSEEHKQKLRIAKLGKKQSSETIAKRVSSGFFETREYREGMKRAFLGRKRDPISKKWLPIAAPQEV